MSRGEDFSNLVSEMGQEDLGEDGDILDAVEELREIEKQIDSELAIKEMPASENALAAYFKSVLKKNAPRLSPEEEIKLANEMCGNVQGDPKEARQTLIESNLLLVITIAKKYLNRGLDFNDLIQEGNDGLITGIDKFDPALGYRISTWVSWWIRHTISRAIDDKTSTIRIPVYMSVAKRQIRGAFSYLIKKRRIENPSFAQIAEITGLKVEWITAAMEAPLEAFSLEARRDEINNKEGGRFIDLIATKIPRPDEAVGMREDRKSVLKIIHSLEEDEEKVLMCQIGLSVEPETFGRDGAEHTLKEVGERSELNMSRRHVQYIRAKALKKLQWPSRRKSLEIALGLANPKSISKKR